MQLKICRIDMINNAISGKVNIDRMTVINLELVSNIMEYVVNLIPLVFFSSIIYIAVHPASPSLVQLIKLKQSLEEDCCDQIYCVL